MKRCLNCHSVTDTFTGDISPCQNCDAEIAILEDIPVYAPEFADESTGFKAEYFDELVQLEGRNFWFRARNRILTWMFGQYVPPDGEILEIGCGNGYVITGLRAMLPKAKLSGSEILINGLGFAKKRLPDVTLMQIDARNIPFSEHFDAIGAFDVIEHIEEDERVLSQIYASLKPGGHVIITVPQHVWLWSALDEYACHVRRYSEPELRSKCESAGFRVKRSTSFVFFLLPAMLASRLLVRNVDVSKMDSKAELNLNPVLNTLFYWIMCLEYGLMKLGINFPVGGSRLIIAQKPSKYKV
jgi:SAM-dependent methyltransferase